LRFFEVVDASLEQLSTLSDSRCRWVGKPTTPPNAGFYPTADITGLVIAADGILGLEDILGDGDLDHDDLVIGFNFAAVTSAHS
jgi:hypothetical protein